MTWIFDHLETVAAGAGIISALWALVSKVDIAIQKHLREEFATKKDLEDGLGHLEKKLDRVIMMIRADDFNKEEKLKLL